MKRLVHRNVMDERFGLKISLTTDVFEMFLLIDLACNFSMIKFESFACLF